MAERDLSGAKAPAILPSLSRLSVTSAAVFSRAGAHGQPVGTVFTPSQRGVEENSVGRPGKFGKVSHQFAAHQRRRALGAGDRDDPERHDIQPPRATTRAPPPARYSRLFIP